MTQDTEKPAYILKLDIIEGVDRFAAEGNEETVLKLYADWLKRVEQLQQKSADMFIKNKQVDAAEAALGAVGIHTKRLS